MNQKVLKFGGSSFRRLEDYHSVCDILLSRLCTALDRLVVVVSAMHGHTDRLLSAARSLSPHFSGDASDSLLTTAETISASLLHIALQSRGIPATMLNASRLGILSDSNFTHATIRSIDSGPLRRALDKFQVVVVTGAQAVDDQHRITMLGRNSSDLTAVALAAALGLAECEIYSDVPGVYSADPYIIPTAKLLPNVSHGQIIEMARSGAKVIHFGAAVCAQRSQVRVICRATPNPGQVGTTIHPQSAPAAAVVLHEKASFFEFDSAQHCESAEVWLSSSGDPFVRMDLQHRPVLAITPGVLPVSDSLGGMQIPFRQLAGKALITVMRDTGELQRVLAEHSVTRALARKYHDQICAGPKSTEQISVGHLPANNGLDRSSDTGFLPWLNK
jgi:aspartate kinase